MTEQQIRDNVQRMFEIFNSDDISGIDEYMTEDTSYRNTSGEVAHGIDEFEQFWSRYNAAFDNLDIDVQEVFVEGNKAVIVYRQTGTHTGEFLGIEPSNNSMNLTGCNIATFDDDGKLVDVYDVIDTLELLRQLDALPSEVDEQLEQAVSQSRLGG